jgi:acyl-coenzyme A synthetase/AMP-(fatty) acid ligase
LGEIEQAIANHDLIDESVVLVVGSDEKDRHLVCFYTGHEATNNELATFLKKTLPDYMIPVNFTHLAQFPINTNGKIDRLAIKHLL